MQSSNPGHFFQTISDQDSDNLRQLKRSNLNGLPIKVGGKCLCLALDRERGLAFVGLGSGDIKSVDLATRKVSLVVKAAHKGPVTALVLLGGKDPRLLSGGWDKQLNIHSGTTGELLAHAADAHGDFIKSLLALPGTNQVMSGSSDKSLRIWSASDLSHQHTIKDHHRGSIISLCLSKESNEVWSGDSLGRILKWNSVGEWDEPLGEETKHDAAVDCLIHDEIHGLISASSDGTIRIHSEKKSISLMSRSLTVTSRGVIYCASGEDVAPVEGYSSPWVGHFDKVTCLDIWRQTIENREGDSVPEEKQSTTDDELELSDLEVEETKTVSASEVKEEPKSRTVKWIISASLDGTLRRWKR